MHDQRHTPQRSVSHVASYRSALRLHVTIFCHLLRSAQTLATRAFTLTIDRSRVTPTRHALLRSPHTDDC